MTPMLHIQCSGCKKWKPFTEYYKNSKSKTGYQSRCKDCSREDSRVWAAKNPEASKEWKAKHPDAVMSIARRQLLKSSYNMTEEDYYNLLAFQNGECAACHTTNLGSGLKYFHVDHDHGCCPGSKSCGKCIRGLLCRTCNIGMGYYKDDVELLKSVVEYLLRGHINLEQLSAMLDVA